MAGHTEDDDSRNKRIAAMRELAEAEQAAAVPVTSSRTSDHPPRKRRWHAILAAFTLIAVLTSAAAAWRGLFPWQRQQKPASNVVSINLAADNLFCPSYGSWSPDGQLVAVLAQMEQCSDPLSGSVSFNVVALFDVRGHLIRQLAVDTAIPGITHTVGPQATSGSSISALVYPQFEGLLWSTDGKRLVLPFDLNRTTNGVLNDLTSGMALLPADGSTAISFTRAPFYGGGYWDLHTKQVINRNSQDVTLAPAYQWSADGTLVASNPSATAPVGNPSGGQSFTIWQAGTVVLDREKSALYFGGNLTVWSPNGRYLIPALGFGGYLDPTATDYKQGSDGQYHLAPRDKGLMAAAGRLKDPTDPYAAQISVAWRADGKLIAATDPNPLIDQVVVNLGSDIPAVSRSVTIFDCVTGAKLLTLKTHPLANRISNFGLYHSSPALGWNAKGDKLFFLDTNFDMLTIWNVSLK